MRGINNVNGLVLSVIIRT